VDQRTKPQVFHQGIGPRSPPLGFLENSCIVLPAGVCSGEFFFPSTQIFSSARSELIVKILFFLSRPPPPFVFFLRERMQDLVPLFQGSCPPAWPDVCGASSPTTLPVGRSHNFRDLQQGAGFFYWFSYFPQWRSWFLVSPPLFPVSKPPSGKNHLRGHLLRGHVSPLPFTVPFP